MPVPWGSRGRWLLNSPHLRVAELRFRQPFGPPGTEHRDEAPWFVVPRRGLLSWQVHGRANVVVPGRLLWLAPGAGIRFGDPADGGVDCLVLSPGPALCAEIFEATGPAMNEIPSTVAPLSPAASFSAEVLVRAVAGGDAVDALRLAEFGTGYVGTLAKILRYAPDSLAGHDNRPDSHIELAQQAVTFLAKHYREPVPRPLDAVAAAVRCSPSHLARVFRREIGTTVHTFRERLRLAAALRAVADGARSLTELAEALGYASHSHFTGNFRRAYGLSPGAARLTLTRSGAEMRRILEAQPVA